MMKIDSRFAQIYSRNCHLTAFRNVALFARIRLGPMKIGICLRIHSCKPIRANRKYLRLQIAARLRGEPTQKQGCSLLQTLTILFKTMTHTNLLYWNCLGGYNYSFQGSLNLFASQLHILVF